ncbi:hypothetical protein [Flavobacterium saccharophilum]|uniref:Uncharacterized protein n=1 Tax=Flavobacterium saccharophilum TaxID=29534 RepID=A0A1M7MB85_9FLAO|nr:hypothetical protein [Flavobacterium saccharophilum]SHM88055.1 hypothetical protein SAMN05444366_4455 [Flavobacterium saccharophilum]
MKRILGITILALLLSNCKKNENLLSTNKLENVNTETSKDSNKSLGANKEKTSTNEVANWAFYKTSESSISETSTKEKIEIINQFKNLKIEIDDKKLKVGNLCTYEYYKSTKTPIKYFESTKTAQLYESIFAKNGIKLGSEITVYQSLYPEKTCKNPWDEILLIDNTLIIVFDDYLVFFKKGITENQGDCFSNTKITSLPITNTIIDGNNVWNELDCNIANLKTKDYIRLPDINGIKIFIIGNFNFDDFTYTLVTLKNNKVITKKDVGFAKEGDEPNTVSEFTQFDINKDYVFSLNTKTKSGEDFKTLKTEKFKIDDKGVIVIIK